MSELNPDFDQKRSLFNRHFFGRRISTSARQTRLHPPTCAPPPQKIPRARARYTHEGCDLVINQQPTTSPLVPAILLDRVLLMARPVKVHPGPTPPSPGGGTCAPCCFIWSPNPREKTHRAETAQPTNASRTPGSPYSQQPPTFS